MDIKGNGMCEKIVKGVAPTSERPCVFEAGHKGDHMDAKGVKTTNHGPMKKFKVEWANGDLELISAHRMTFSGATNHRDSSTIIFWTEYVQTRLINPAHVKQAYEVKEPVFAVLDINGTEVKVPVTLK